MTAEHTADLQQIRDAYKRSEDRRRVVLNMKAMEIGAEELDKLEADERVVGTPEEFSAWKVALQELQVCSRVSSFVSPLLLTGALQT